MKWDIDIYICTLVLVGILRGGQGTKRKGGRETSGAMVDHSYGKFSGRQKCVIGLVEDNQRMVYGT